MFNLSKYIIKIFHYFAILYHTFAINLSFIMQFTYKKREAELLGSIEEANPELAQRIRQLMFTFEDLMKLDNKSIQTLLKEVTSEELAIALKGASDAIKEKIFSNMSERASAMLKEDMESMGPVRLSEVEQMQTKIALTAKRLEAEGKIIITGENEQFI